MVLSEFMWKKTGTLRIGGCRGWGRRGKGQERPGLGVQGHGTGTPELEALGFQEQK